MSVVGTLGPVASSLDIEIIGVLIIGLLFVYMLGLVVSSAYINFTPKALASFIMVIALIFWTLPWLIIGDLLMIGISFFLTVILSVYTLLSIRRKRKKRRTGGGTNIPTGGNNQ